MEDLIVKYLDKNLTKEEELLVETYFQSHPEEYAQLQSIIDLDQRLMKEFTYKVEPQFESDLSKNLRPALTPKLDISLEKESFLSWEIFIGLLFGLASAIYLIINKNSFTTTDSIPFEINPHYFTLAFMSMLCLLGFYFLDKILAERKRNLNMISL